ncbi:class I SAM-dependent methyltransferase [uncultured Brevundimonas sp.]|uniref:class I SAM-dependent DNA methyltransferase n=1 Tax=uncultured Brevundimonas sp. TaxID=213418 RepID=UPI0030EE7C9B|tara:strand:+ start:626 stop:1219 length:594 start_codon:yes stop_codon:yes gene_type:complete
MPENWDQHAEGWDQDAQVRSYSDKALSSLFNHVDVRKDIWRTRRVLDFGCGTGLLTEKLSPLVKEVVSVDTSEKMIQALKGKALGNVTAVCADLNDETVRRSASWFSGFHLIVASSVCSFLPDYESTVDVLSRALVPDGRFVQWDWLSSDGGDFGLTESRVANALTLANLRDVRVEQAFSFQADDQNMAVLIGLGAA